MQIGKGKQGVIIGEYADKGLGDLLRKESDKNHTIGWIEPACDNPQWILWFTAHGDALLYTSRESTGAVLGDPIRAQARGPNKNLDEVLIGIKRIAGYADESSNVDSHNLRIIHDIIKQVNKALPLKN